MTVYWRYMLPFFHAERSPSWQRYLEVPAPVARAVSHRRGGGKAGWLADHTRDAASCVASEPTQAQVESGHCHKSLGGSKGVCCIRLLVGAKVCVA